MTVGVEVKVAVAVNVAVAVAVIVVVAVTVARHSRNCSDRHLCSRVGGSQSQA